MNWNRPFAPNFLKKFDKKLLLNKPETWSARTHLVWYYGILFCLILAGICFIYPNDARANTGVIFWIFFVSIISLLAFIFWLIYLLRFNVFKRFGNISGINRLKVFGLYFAIIAMIVFFTYIPPIVETIRANNKYGDDEIVNDINNYNKFLNQLEYDSVEHKWSLDTVIVREEEYGMLDDEKKEIETLESNRDSRIRRIDSSAFTSSIYEGDTVVKLKKGVYKLYTCPDYEKLKVRDADTYSTTKAINKIGIYKTITKHFIRPDIAKTQAAINALIKKYNYDEEEKNNKYDYVKTYTSSDDTTYEHRVEVRYNLNTTRHSIENIVDRKYRFSGHEPAWQLRVIFYVSLCITLLLFTFRHSTKKTFFLSVLTAVVLSILTSLFIAFSKGGEQFSLSTLIFYTLLYAAIGSTVFMSKIRNAVAGLCINLFVWAIPFLPLLIATLINVMIKERHYREQLIHSNAQLNYGAMERNFLYGEIFGIVILLILLPTFIHKLYRKWYALAEE